MNGFATLWSAEMNKTPGKLAIAHGQHSFSRRYSMNDDPCSAILCAKYNMMDNVMHRAVTFEGEQRGDEARRAFHHIEQGR